MSLQSQVKDIISCVQSGDAATDHLSKATETLLDAKQIAVVLG
jgi:hypothetical protein